LSENPQQPNKVLVIGSGPIVIGQAAEFDYAGTQACKALREEGVYTILVNSNPATIMTDRDIADRVYIEPLTVPVLERIIATERPDGLLPTLGGQTGLNLAVALADAGVLDRYHVRLLGTPLETIRKAEDRDFFRQFLLDIGEPMPPNRTVNSMAEARDYRNEVGLPLVVRPAYTLGGTGGERSADHRLQDRAFREPINSADSSRVAGWLARRAMISPGMGWRRTCFVRPSSLGPTGPARLSIWARTAAVVSRSR